MEREAAGFRQTLRYKCDAFMHFVVRGSFVQRCFETCSQFIRRPAPQ